MMKHGKILFYNEQSGDGIVITEDKKKLKFTVQDWDDFDTMPSLGLEVSFDFKNETPVSLTSTTQNSADIKEETLKAQIHSQDVQLRDLTNKDFTTHKYKNESLTRAEKELTTLLNNSSSTLELLNKKISLSSDILTSMSGYLDNITK